MKPLPLPRVLILDDEPENLKSLERALRNEFQVDTFVNPQEALVAARNYTYAVAISDQRMPEMTGTEFLSSLSKISEKTRRVMLTAFTDPQPLLDAINRAEIYRYLLKPWNEVELLGVIRQAAEAFKLDEKNANLLLELSQLNQTLESEVEVRTAELKLANEKLSELAMTDPLTNTLNRRAFETALSEEIDRSARYRHVLSIAMIDVDEFKAFNDMEGHVYGDEALKRISQTIGRMIRKTDKLARYGGEEFVLLMPETPLESAREICQRLRRAIEKTHFQGANQSAYLTISIGISTFPEFGEVAKEIVDSADQALYAAKEQGRNQVVTKKDGTFFLSRTNEP